MFADPRADALVEIFASQWLNLGKIAGCQTRRIASSGLDENLRRDAMLEETRRFSAESEFAKIEAS